MDGTRRRAACCRQTHQRLFLRLRGPAVGLAVLLLFLITGQAWAAIELAYFRGTSSASSILLEWATISEFNVSGFEILCKMESEPDTAFHHIGARIAQGTPTQGASYSFNVTALEEGVRYCFRLREATTDNTPGEQFDICGYGLGIMPAVLDVVGDVTPTSIVLQSPPGVTPAPTLQTPGGFVPGDVTPTPFAANQFTSPLDPFDSPLGQPTSPLPTPPDQFSDPNVASIGLSPTPTVTPTPSATATVQAPGSLIGGTNFTLDPFALASQTPTFTPAMMEMPTETPTETATEISGAPFVQQSPLVFDPGAVGPDSVQPSLPMEEPATPTPIYFVVTATPTPDPVLAAAPVFTPWPTPTQPAPFQAGSLLAPTSQNLMVMLLCLIFLSASGLGILGLVTSIIYMRSQTVYRDRLPGPYYDRRRY